MTLKEGPADTAATGAFAPGLPGEAPAQADQAPAAYWRAFSLVAFTMNRFVVDQVIRAARLFDNDTETMILFGTVAHLNVAHLMPPGSRPTRVLGANGRVPDAQPQLRAVRLRDLEQITGRPRETLRRKLEGLEAQGRLLRRPDGYVIDVNTVDPTMHALSVDGVRRFMDAARVIEAALRDAEQTLAAEPKP
ncbi:MAG: hypothetical protein J0M00_17060 [Burkholderiales bacterium]|nr:hypothetical protein [Burkholderiales bacterium]